MNNYSYPNQTFAIISSPFYDQYNQCYKNVLMVNIEPSGPIRRIVRRIILPRLSPFQVSTPCNPIQKCGLVLQSLKTELGCGCDLMTPDEIPDLISFLLSNGYQIETQISNMLNQNKNTKLTNKNINFMVTFYGDKQPNITYMR